MIKKIKLMADYDCYPVWDMDEIGEIDPSELPLSKETIKRLMNCFWKRLRKNLAIADLVEVGLGIQEQMSRQWFRMAINRTKLRFKTIAMVREYPKVILKGLSAIAGLLAAATAVQSQSLPFPQPPQWQAQQLSAGEWYNQGVDKLEAGDYEGALASFTESIKLNAQDADAFYNRAYTHHSLGNYEAAVADYSQAIKLNSQFAYAYGNRCYAHYLMKNYGAAIEDCSKAVELQPNFADFYIYRANAQDELGNYQAALADYSDAIRLNPDNANVYYNRGLAYNRLGDDKKALADYTESIRLNGESAEAFYNRGVTHLKLGNSEQATTDLKQAAALFTAQGKPENAQQALEALKKMEGAAQESVREEETREIEETEEMTND